MLTKSSAAGGRAYVVWRSLKRLLPPVARSDPRVIHVLTEFYGVVCFGNSEVDTAIS
jgi:hypothetical protein